MGNWEKDLSPIARERLAKIGELTQEEKEKMLDSEKVNSLLSEFYQGQIDPESLWKKLKAEGKSSLLREVQARLVDSLSFGSTPAELQRKRDGILAIESLKKEQNTSTIELNLRRIEDLQKRHGAEIEQAYNGIRAEVERNPRLRVKQVQQGQNTMVVQLTIDEAIKQLPQWRDFLSNQEKRYSQEFGRAIERLKRELK
ncbi:MAG: hypothetical protein MUO80_03750 [Dehalococcoidia bacterium]|nr:hypothetical protein [Dehalococcoidia bacterium]